MPTYARAAQFKHDYAALSPEERQAVKRALAKFLEDLPSHRFRRSLRVKGVRGSPGVFEMTWAGDGRATFQFGPEIREGEPHVIWRRIGGHEIFSAP